MKNVMIDIETMGLGQRAALLQIGLVPFDEDFMLYQDYIKLIEIDVRSSVDAGGAIDPDTVLWWALKGGFAYQTDLPCSIESGLNAFTEYLNMIKPDLIWANGTTFDISCIEFYYNQLNMPVPWKYNAPRDLRSYREAYYMLGVKPVVPPEVTHNPVDDCVSQINQMRALYDAAKAL